MEKKIINIATLKLLRQERGWDQATLAARAGIDRTILSRLERELQTDLKASVLVAIARALKVPVDVLLAPPLTVQLATAPELAAEWQVLLSKIASLTPDRQNQLSALVQVYLNTTPVEPPEEVLPDNVN